MVMMVQIPGGEFCRKKVSKVNLEKDDVFKGLDELCNW
jgi:hypothetical protein